MPKFAANLAFLFAELPYLDRFSAAAEAGFEAVEVPYPYEFAAKDTERALLTHGLDLVLINAPPPNYTGGEPGYAAIPAMVERFQRDVRRVLRYSEVLNAKNIHLMAGVVEGPEAREVFVKNLQWAADFAPYQQFTIEPISPGEVPGYFLNDYALAAEVLEEVSRKNVGLQFDTHSATQIHGDLMQAWNAYGDRACHIQVSSGAKRSQPLPGSEEMLEFLTAVDGVGYKGWVSAEYTPTTAQTEDSLAWMQTPELAQAV